MVRGKYEGLYLRYSQRAKEFFRSEGYAYGYLNSSHKYILVWDGKISTSDTTKDFIRFRDKVSNGCGGKGGWIKPPQFMFKASCDKHDELYTIGGTEEDRKSDDKKFLELMFEDTERSNGFDRYYFKLWAYAYYGAVRLLGEKYFYYRAENAV